MDQIILRPPPSLTTSEGSTLLIPCVASTDPTFSDTVEGTTSVFGITITADRQNNGIVTCQVGSEKADVNISVLGK